jgi:oxygen-independent coproporphyrinogen-3 oxidase
MDFLSEMRESGATRISMGMQSAVPHVLETLDRTHKPESVMNAVQAAVSAGFENISVDLIYGTPGESIEDWKTSVTAAMELPVNHISAYALIVERGTKLAAQIARGKFSLPDDDETAEKYLIADDAFESAGFSWYELSNWSKPDGECRHNIAYWDGSHWWGVGPGAHSYVDKKRWWNVKHPSTYQQKIFRSESPELSSEILTGENLADEFVMLQIRRREGIQLTALSDLQKKRAELFLGSGHLEEKSWSENKLVLSKSGRLIADRIVRELVM